MLNKVQSILIKGGNNSEDVEKMIAEHYEYASSQHSTAKKIAECIRTIY